MWIRANGVGIPRPARIDPAKRERADRRFYYQYHRDYGHDTDNCRELQKAIEQLIQNGKLENFTNRRHRDPEDQGDDRDGNKKPRNEAAGVINMIVGGEIPKEKRLKRARKDENQLPDITFGPEDGQHVQHPHNDALVISAHIQNFLVKRLLIDDRSTVNALS